MDYVGQGLDKKPNLQQINFYPSFGRKNSFYISSRFFAGQKEKKKRTREKKIGKGRKGKDRKTRRIKGQIKEKSKNK